MSNRMNFVAVFEIWEDDKMQYIPVVMEGDYIPPQDDMVLRQTLCEIVNEQYGYETLDLIGVSVGGQMKWSDGHGSR